MLSPTELVHKIVDSLSRTEVSKRKHPLSECLLGFIYLLYFISHTLGAIRTVVTWSVAIIIRITSAVLF